MTIKRYKEVMLGFASLLSDMVECEHLTHYERFEAIEKLTFEIKEAGRWGISNTPNKGKVGKEQLENDLKDSGDSLASILDKKTQKNEKRSTLREEVKWLFDKIDAVGQKQEVLNNDTQK